MIIDVEKTEAIEAVRAAAFTTEEGRSIVHSFTSGGLMLGADWDTDDVVAFIERADRVAWISNLVGHDLGVEGDGRVLLFDVRAPGDVEL